MLDVRQDAELIRRVTRKVYWNSRYARLRTQIDEEDLIQMVFLKLLHRDNYMKYSDEYSLVGFLYRVANGCAISFSNKRSNINEFPILDDTVKGEGGGRVLLDSLVSDTPDIDMDTEYRIRHISDILSSEENPRIVIRYQDMDVPVSQRSLFKFFIGTRMCKKEAKEYIINLNTGMPVMQTTFNGMWNRMVSSVGRILLEC